jgi:NADPH:quinone reductase-like Zn-dependent oxidoreductase
MKAAVVQGPGKIPVYADFDLPTPVEGERLIHVTAAALSQLARGRVAGRHYSSAGDFPFIAGVDGVGRLDDGSRVYFLLPRAPFGAMAERVVVPAVQCMPLPDDLDDVTAAAIANPGMSSWVAFVERAHLQHGETVLVNGATGTSGRLAVQIAKLLGAKKVIATGRNPQALASLAAIGADLTIPLVADEAAMEASFRSAFADGIDVVIDYLWGRSAERVLIAAAKAAPKSKPIRFVQVGSASGGEIALKSEVLRSAPIELLGSGLGSVPGPRFFAAISAVFAAARPAGLQIATRAIPLAEVEKAWTDTGDARRLVLTVNG